MQGKQVKFNLTTDEYDLVQDFCAAVRTGRHKVAKHMLLIGIQNYMRAAEQEKKRREMQKEVDQLQAQVKERANGNSELGKSEGHTEETPVSSASNSGEGQGQAADGASAPG